MPVSVFAVAGIARPERFFADLRAAGYTLAGQLEFRDHHRFTTDDVVRIVAAARASGAVAVVTTEKDAVRLESLVSQDLPFLAVPLQTAIEPGDALASWLGERLTSVRARARRN
jgi:tetraacyldisaccharide 4'-kinase